ncbi:hypothetical protein AAF712_005543 [Marasmius tenuissimus]|uniref:Uncharacterized protein n=1 Tax=Marasmius tenuissimus TaxID=585030 RepID=A0ABR3A432_9AGAR
MVQVNRKRKITTDAFGGSSDLSSPPSPTRPLPDDVPQEAVAPTKGKNKTAPSRSSRRIAGVKVGENLGEDSKSTGQPAPKRKKTNRDQVRDKQAGSRSVTEDGSTTVEDAAAATSGESQKGENMDSRKPEEAGVGEDNIQEEDANGDEDGEEDDEDGEDDYNMDDPFGIHPKDTRKEVKANEAIRRYLAAPSSNRLKAGTQAYIRAHASHCLAAAVTCPELSQDVLVTREGQLKCLYHFAVDKTSRKTDKSEGRLTGVPYSVKGTGKKKNQNKDSEGNSNRKRTKNLLDVYSRLDLPRVEDGGEQHCHCGCRLEDAIWGLYLWKTGRIEYNGKVQGYGKEHIPPRQRNFEITRLKSNKFELDDVWTHVKVNGLQYRERSEAERRLARASRLQSQEGEVKGAEESLDDAKLEGLIVMEQ